MGKLKTSDVVKQIREDARRDARLRAADVEAGLKGLVIPLCNAGLVDGVDPDDGVIRREPTLVCAACRSPFPDGDAEPYVEGPVTCECGSFVWRATDV